MLFHHSYPLTKPNNCLYDKSQTLNPSYCFHHKSFSYVGARCFHLCFNPPNLEVPILAFMTNLENFMTNRQPQAR